MMMLPPDRSAGADDFGAAPLSEINVTPLVDVMLVLLIIFMVAAPLMTVGIPVQLPKTASRMTPAENRPIVISIDQNGQLFLDKEALSEETMAPRLRALISENPQQVVLVRGDKNVAYGRILEVMGQINVAGVSKVSLIAQAQGGVAAP